MNLSIIMALVKLRLLRVVKDRSNLVWLLLMPMVFSFLMGQLMGDWSQDGPDRRPRFMVYDQDGSVTVDQLLAPLLDNDKFMVVRADTTISRDQARLLVEGGRITAALLIPADFSSRMVSGQPDTLNLFYDSERLSSQTLRTLLDESLLRINARHAARTLVVAPDSLGQALPGRSTNLDEQAFQEQWDHPRVTMAVSTLGRRQEQELALNRSAQHAGPAYTLFFMMMFLMMSAKDLVAERQDRTLDRLLVSRAGSGDLVVGFFLGGLALGLFQAGILLTLNMLPPFRVDYGDSLAGLVSVVFLFGGFCSAASVLLGCLARSGPQADGLGMTLTLVMAALGGLWWPLEIVPPFMQKIGHSLPSGQAIQVFHDMIGRGYGLAQLWPWLLGLGAWFLVTMLLAVGRFRRLVT